MRISDTIFMLKVYYWDKCPHCRKTIEFLKARNIPFVAYDIEKQSPDVIQKIIDVNGGDDWVVPTLEYKNQWRAGEVFDASKLTSQLKQWGLI